MTFPAEIGSQTTELIISWSLTRSEAYVSPKLNRSLGERIRSRQAPTE